MGDLLVGLALPSRLPAAAVPILLLMLTSLLMLAMYA